MRTSLVTLCCYLESAWSRESVSSRGRRLSLRGFPLSAKGDALLSLTVLCGMQADTGDQHREFSMEKIENKVKISKENMVILENPHFIPHMSSFYAYFLYEGPGNKHQSHFSFKSTNAHFCFLFLLMTKQCFSIFPSLFLSLI